MERLGIEHKDLLVPRLKAAASPLSEYTFPNLYLFRANHDYEVLIDRDVFVKGRSYDGHTYLMPTADVRTLDLARLQELMREVEFLFPVPEDWLAAFTARVRGPFQRGRRGLRLHRRENEHL